MQTPKVRISSSEVPRKTSPRTVSSEGQPKVSPRVVRKLKVTASDTETSSNRTSPKVSDRRSPRNPVGEKKRPSRIAQLEGDLEKVKDQLISSESWRKQAQEDAEESKKKLLAINIEVKKDQNSVDSVTLTTAIDEIEKLKYQLEMVAESEASQTRHAEFAQNELHSLKENLAETLLLMGDVKDQLRDCKESEAQAKSIVSETLMQLETAKRTVETLRSEGMKSVEAYDAIASELEQSRARVNALEDLVNKFKSFEVQDLAIDESSDSTREELDTVKSEVGQLRSALEAAEHRYIEELNRREEEMSKTNELMEQLKFASSQRENALENELNKSRMEIEDLKANLMDKETELQGICEENEFLSTRLKSVLSGQGENDLEKLLEKSRAEIENLKAGLMEKEAEEEAVRAAEREALMKVSYMKEEVEKSNRKAIRVAEQLDAAQAAKAEVEAELRRLKVQADQWRKAAEAAAAMLSSGNNGKYVERTGSMDSPYNPRTGKVGSPYSEDVEEDLLKRKNPNMLKKIGVLWKKPQK